MGDIPKHVLEKIREAKEKQLKELDLGNDWETKDDQKLTKIPPEVFELEQLEVLNLHYNLLTSVPDSITQLQNLTTLNLSQNKLTEIPESITQLQSLTTLNLSNTGLTEIPESITQLQNLTTLNLHDNQLTEIPDSITQLQNLTGLYSGGNKLTEIPDSINQLQSLTILNLAYNQLTEIPDSIIQLQNLATLYLDGNKLTKIPDSITQLQSLIMLDLSNTGLTEIPEFITRLQKLTMLGLRGNSIKNPPPAIALGGIEDIRDFFRQREAEGEAPLYEAKLLIVGEAGAGKTSLAKKIQDRKYKLRKDEDSTKGIDVVRWSFPREDGEEFWINIWDFGGQEVYHATHQFFLTKRSLYALVADTRKEDTDFYYWLNVVELLSDNSPLLIIKNEKQDRHREINERQLRGRFTNLKETLTTNLDTNRGLDEVVNEIKHYIQTLPQVGTPLPKTWVKVREALDKDERNYISLEEYLKICKQNGFPEQRDNLQLSGYLHDLGICLHFQDDPVLRKTVILEPKWGTTAVYKVLDNKKVIRNLGRFTRADLAEIWDEPEYANMHHELLQLMLNFKLCYKIPGSDDTYIAPQLLTENQPEYDWDEADNLFLRYRYEFMPKGIATRFIVAMQRWIADQGCVWKSGVVLQKDETRAEVMEHYEQKEIRIRIAGRYKRDLMTEVILRLDEIHDSYNRLKCDKLISCNCKECGGSQKPYFYEYEVLRRFVADSKEIQCQKSYEMVNPRGLMDDVIDRRQFSEREAGRGGDIIFEKPIEKVFIQRTRDGDNIVEDEEKKKPEDSVAIKSAWANGSFFLFAFAVVIAGLCVVAKIVPPYVLSIVLVSGVVFVLLIGALQLRQDNRISEKSFMQLVGMVIKQLPLIGRLAKKTKSNK